MSDAIHSCPSPLAHQASSSRLSVHSRKQGAIIQLRRVVTCLILTGLFAARAHAAGDVVISQIYGGGGNPGTTLRNDFVELFNRSASAVSLSGWSLQYASSTGSSWDRTVLAGTLQPGQFYLISLAAGGEGTTNLPTADMSGSSNISATAGKLALASNTNILSGTCPTGVVDFVGYGAANCSETGTASTFSNTTAILRQGSGCTDTDNNLADFVTASPSPRNTSSALNPCGTLPPPPPPPPPSAGFPRPTIGTTPLTFAHFAQGGGYQTSFTLTNLSAIATSVTLRFFSQSGAVIDSTVIPLQAFGSARTAMVGNDLRVGWAEATPSPAANIVGTETIQLFNGQVLIMEASVLAAPSDRKLVLPIYETNGYGTGVALVNLGLAPSEIVLTVRDQSGVLIAVRTLNLGPLGQTAKFVSELFTVISNFEGTLEVSSATSVAALALRQNLTSGIFSSLPVSPAPTETFFSPGVGIMARIVQEIAQVRNTIDVAMYSFTRNEIADALIYAKNHGVQVRIIADSSQANEAGSDIARLEAAGIPVKRTTGGAGGLMHHKYAIFDGRMVLTGSYNWSTNAEENSDENAIFIGDDGVISAYRSNFDSMWATR